MKKLSAVFIISLMLFGVTACGGNADKGTDGNVGKNETNSLQQDIENAGDDMKDAADDIMGDGAHNNDKTNGKNETGNSTAGSNNAGGASSSNNAGDTSGTNK